MVAFAGPEVRDQTCALHTLQPNGNCRPCLCQARGFTALLLGIREREHALLGLVVGSRPTICLFRGFGQDGLHQTWCSPCCQMCASCCWTHLNFSRHSLTPVPGKLLRDRRSRACQLSQIQNILDMNPLPFKRVKIHCLPGIIVCKSAEEFYIYKQHPKKTANQHAVCHPE
jgi:hypothetical protein